MTKILPLSPRLTKYLQTRGLTAKFTKQAALFARDPRHPSLNTELLEPKHLKFYSFRLGRKYRAIFVYLPEEQGIQIIDINDHYH
jgi:plasmid maintenance system killer protein